eukprot:CFRG1232T1
MIMDSLPLPVVVPGVVLANVISLLPSIDYGVGIILNNRKAVNEKCSTNSDKCDFSNIPSEIASNLTLTHPVAMCGRDFMRILTDEFGDPLPDATAGWYVVRRNSVLSPTLRETYFTFQLATGHSTQSEMTSLNLLAPSPMLTPNVRSQGAVFFAIFSACAETGHSSMQTFNHKFFVHKKESNCLTPVQLRICNMDMFDSGRYWSTAAELAPISSLSDSPHVLTDNENQDDMRHKDTNDIILHTLSTLSELITQVSQTDQQVEVLAHDL